MLQASTLPVHDQHSMPPPHTSRTQANTSQSPPPQAKPPQNSTDHKLITSNSTKITKLIINPYLSWELRRVKFVKSVAEEGLLRIGVFASQGDERFFIARFWDLSRHIFFRDFWKIGSDLFYFIVFISVAYYGRRGWYNLILNEGSEISYRHEINWYRECSVDGDQLRK